MSEEGEGGERMREARGGGRERREREGEKRRGGKGEWGGEKKKGRKEIMREKSHKCIFTRGRRSTCSLHIRSNTVWKKVTGLQKNNRTSTHF